MKITFDWLKDHLKTNLKEKNLLEQLTNIGLEVESVQSLSSDNQLFKVAKIIKTEKHPNAVHPCPFSLLIFTFKVCLFLE